MKEEPRVFLTNSGTEAVEGAVKLARLRDRAAVPRVVPGRIPRRTVRIRVAHRVQGPSTTPASGRCCPASSTPPFGHVADLKWFDEVLFDRRCRPPRVAAISRRTDPGRGRLRRPHRGRLHGRRCAGSATSTASCSSPTRFNAAPAARARCGPSRTGTWSPTSSPPAKGDRQRHDLGRVHRPRLAHDKWGPGAHRHHVRRQPSRVRASLATIKLLEGGLMAQRVARGAELIGRDCASCRRSSRR